MQWERFFFINFQISDFFFHFQFIHRFEISAFFMNKSMTGKEKKISILEREYTNSKVRVSIVYTKY
jgi:hypothetical protein